MLFEIIVILLLNGSLFFSGEINTTLRRNLKSKVINNIRSCHYSRTHKKYRCSEEVGFFFSLLCWCRVPKGGLSYPAEWIISEGCEEALREEEWLLVSRGVLGCTGLCTASHLPNRSTCWRQLLVVLEAISRAQRRAGESTGNLGTCPEGHSPWHELFSALLNHHCLMGITSYWILS